MRKVGALLSFFAILGLAVPAAFAQAPAPAPAPKVTINGLVDFVATYYKNWTGGNGTGGTGGLSASDVTDSRDQGFYTRERGVFTITGEVGRVKGVWAIELDFVNGAGVIGNAGNAYNGGLQGASQSGTSGNFDLDTDVASMVETKWLYIETPITGPGSMMPFIPVTTIARLGAQPFRGHDYKFGIHASGDFPGATFETTWAPNVRSTFTWVAIGERLDPIIAPNAKDNWAILLSVEYDVFKGLTIKPTYSYVDYRGGNCGTANLGTPPTNGFQPNSCPGGVAVIGTAGAGVVVASGIPPTKPLNSHRHTFGGDVRWTTGPWSLQPTFYYQIGEQDIIRPFGTAGCGAGSPATGCNDTVDISAWIFDTIAGFRTGPLNLQGRFMYTSGMGAEHRVQNGADVGYYRPINPGFAYMTGWSDIWTGGIDYITALNVGVSSMTLRESPSYDKYGRIFLGFAADYALTPALTFSGLANVSWTAEKVDNNSTLTATGLQGCPSIVTTTACASNGRGKESYLGTELAAGMTYRFAPNIALDLIGSYLFAGDALSHAGVSAAGGTGTRSADDVYKLSARVRVTF